MAENSKSGTVLGALLHVSIALFSLGVLIASAISLSEINDITGGGGGTSRHQGVAGWLLFVGIAGLIMQIIFTIVSGLYSAEVIKAQFTKFGAVAIICTVILGLAMFSGGAASAANAADIQSKYNGGFETLRNSQAAAAALAILGALDCGVTTIMLIMKIAKSRNNE